MPKRLPIRRPQDADVGRLHTPEGRKEKIRLDLNEGYGMLDASVLKGIRDLTSEEISTYPEYGPLTEKVSKYVGIASERILLTNGSDHAISLLIELLFKKKDRVLLPVPTFFIYNHFLALKGIQAIEIPYYDRKTKFAFPLKEIIAKLDRADGLMVCNPGNPTGAGISQTDLKALIKKVGEKGIPLIIDEAYFEYSGVTAVPFLDENPNLIVIRTFSKSFGLAGLRIGYVMASARIIQDLLKYKLPWSVNHVAVHAASTVLDQKKYFQTALDEQSRSKSILAGALRKAHAQVYDTQTNFLVCKFSDLDRVTKRLKESGILIQDISRYAANHGILERAARITVPSKKDLPKVLRAIGSLMT